MKRKIENLVRENIRRLKPYASARDEFDGEAVVWLDANENPWGPGLEGTAGPAGDVADLNRYPDPHQRALKKEIARLRGVEPGAVFVGNGSDEIIDLLFRTFCEPGQEEVVILPPTYGMYRVLADVHPARVVEVPLDNNFQPDIPAIQKEISEKTKLLFICSPNNPTGNVADSERVTSILNIFGGVVVVDEAYIDFAPEKSLLELIHEYPNLVVLQTFSKARALAGIRLGIAFGQPELVDWLSRVKLPYNVNRLTLEVALRALREPATEERMTGILRERASLNDFLEKMPSVKRTFPSDANFILVAVEDAPGMYRKLLQRGIVVRLRSGIPGWGEALRVTVGTPEEMKKLKEAWQSIELEMTNSES